MTQEAQAADKGIAQGGIAQMPDVSRLIGIDVCMLHNNFPGLLRTGSAAESPLSDACSQFGSKGAAVEMEIQITAPGDIRLPYSGNSPGIRCEFPRNFDRGALDFSGEVKCNRQSQFTQFDFGWNSEIQRVVMDVVSFRYPVQERFF